MTKLNGGSTHRTNVTGIYLKWSLIILGPFLILAAAFFYYLHVFRDKATWEDLEESFMERQIERLEEERMEELRREVGQRQRQKY